MKLFLKKWIFEKGAKTNDVSAESSFSTETWRLQPWLWGDEEIVLKGGAKKSVKAGKDGKVVEQKNVYAQRSSGLISRIQTSYRSRINAAAADGKRV
jgi:hypothetical protein